MRPINVPGSLNLVVKIPRPRPIGPSDQLPPCEPSGDCAESIDGLYWSDSESIGAMSYESDAYVIDPILADSEQTALFWFVDGDGYPFQPYMNAAWLKGQTCGCVIDWDVTFDGEVTPSEINAPYVAIVGDVILVWLQSDLAYAVGTLTISATCNGTTYGPITMTIEAGGS
jgi:hypothetical protein